MSPTSYQTALLRDIELVRLKGFEPLTYCVEDRCSCTELRGYINGAIGENRTPNLLITSQLHYLIVLRWHNY